MKTFTNLFLCLGLSSTVIGQTLQIGPSTTTTPYMWPAVPNGTVKSVLTAGDVVAGYTLAGLGDGMGAFDNGGNTFTLLMNHEMGATAGTVHAHGQAGAFVSKWVINKSNLQVISGGDLGTTVKLWNGSAYTTYNATNTTTLAAFNRFCAGDLPLVSAFYNANTGKGTQDRIFMNGEEAGSEGRAFAHVASGTESGTIYELPYLGKFSWENSVASPYASDKTIVVGMDDATPGQVYVYVGNKNSTGTNVIEKAGLHGGKLYGVAVLGLVNEQSTSFPAANTPFNLIDMGTVHNITGATLNTNSNNMGVTNFLRPEDGAWDPNRPTDFYFVTTNSFTSPSRLWRLRFNDINNPELGGKIEVMLTGTEGPKMMDNMCMDNHGHILIQEDPGGQNHTAKVWQYKISSDALTLVMDQDSTRFKTGQPNFITFDEESSGILDAQGILGAGWFLLYDQVHASQPLPVVEGGQLIAFYNPATAAANPEINLQGNATSIPDGNTAVSSTNNTDFGLVNVGTTLSKTFVIQNTNSGTLIVSSLYMDGANAGDFTISGPLTPFTVGPNGTQSITINFNTPLSGLRSAKLNVVSSDYDENIYDVVLQATGATYEINVQGNSSTINSGNTSVSTNDNTDFGSAIYNNAIVKTFNIQNTGTGSLSINGMAFNGTNTSVYSFVNAPTFPVTLSGGASLTFSVQYLSPVPGTHMATLSIMSNDMDEANYTFNIHAKSLMDVGIATANKTNALVVLYPNPAENEANLKVTLEKQEALSVKVYDVLGREVASVGEKVYAEGEQTISLNTSSLSNGDYFVHLKTSGKTLTLKLVIHH